MATYADLVQDTRAMAGVPRSVVSDKSLARQIWRKCVEFVTEVAEIGGNDARTPRTEASVTIPAALLDGITLPTVANMIKLIGVELTYSTGVRQWVTVVEANLRNDFVGAVPAAFIRGAKMYPMPADGTGIWTEDNVLNAGWKNISSASAEYFTYPTEITDLGDTFPLDAVFQDAALLGVASRYSPALTGEAGLAKREMLTSLSRAIETEVESVEAVNLF